MKNTKIVLVAAWDGWCASCAVERPLVLTRSGRLGLRTWLTAPVAESRPLTLTCRLCGFNDVVPLEADDPPVLLPDASATPVDATGPAVPTAADGGSTPTVAGAAPLAQTPVPVPGRPADAPLAPALPVPGQSTVAPPRVPVLSHDAGEPVLTAAPAHVTADSHRDPELDRVRGALGEALSALLAQRTALAGRVQPVPAVAPLAPAVAAPALPTQRSSSSDDDGLATLHLLADGLDLLSSSRP